MKNMLHVIAQIALAKIARTAEHIGASPLLISVLVFVLTSAK